MGLRAQSEGAHAGIAGRTTGRSDHQLASTTGLPSLERTKLWNGLAANRNQGRQSGSTRALAQQVEEFLAQIDFLRGEIEAVRKKLR